MKAAAAGGKYEIVSLIGWLTAFVSDTTKAFAEHGALPGFRQLDVGNIGLVECAAAFPRREKRR